MTPSSQIPHPQKLSATRRGETVRLVHIEAGRRLTHRLAELGLTPGVTMHVVHKNGGPMLVAVRGTRLALGRGVAEKIQVTPVSAFPQADTPNDSTAIPRKSDKERINCQ